MPDSIQNHPLGVMTVLYAVVIFFFWLLNGEAPVKEEYLATRELPRNHRIDPGDLQRPSDFARSLGFYMASPSSLAGKYVLKGPILKGHQIRSGELAAAPDLKVADHMRIVALSVPADTRTLLSLDAGTKIELVGEDANARTIASAAGTVHAIVCDEKGEQQKCQSLLEIRSDDVPILAKFLPALRLVTRSSPPAN
jgi:hypothetical protein